MKHLHLLYTLLFDVAVLLFFGLAYPHHLHYQEQYQLFLFDWDYVWDIVKLPGGVADLFGRFCTQFFLFAWVGALIIALLLSLVQLLTLRLANYGWLYGLSFVPSFLLWLFLLDENALFGAVWAVLLTQLAFCGLLRLPNGWVRRILSIVAFLILYWVAFGGNHYYRIPNTFPTLFYAAWFSAMIIPLVMWLVVRGKKSENAQQQNNSLTPHLLVIASFALVAVVFGTIIWEKANFKAERVMQYDFMACHQQWNRILATANAEKPNNQIGVTVQNLALAMHGQLADHLFDYRRVPAAISDWHRPISSSAATKWLANISRRCRRHSSIATLPTRHYRY